MAKPARLPTVCAEQSYFVTTSADHKRFLFQSEPLANLFIETLYSYRRQNKFLLHEFVLMPNHLHLVLTPTGITLERAMQFIKGGYSHRVNSELGKKLEVWQRGFTDRRIRNRSEYEGFREYIHMNPVEAGWSAGQKIFGIRRPTRDSTWIRLRLTSAAEADHPQLVSARLKAVPLPEQGATNFGFHRG